MNYLKINEGNIQSFTYEKTIVSNKSILGSCELGKAEIQLLNNSNEYSIYKNNWIKTHFGSMFVYDVAPVQEKINIKLSCYDIKHKLDTPYDKNIFKFPMTILEWREAIASEYGITFNDDKNFPNANYKLNTHPFVEENSSVRMVFSNIAQACGCAIDTDNVDNFYFVFKDDKISNINDWIELTTEKEKTLPINMISLGRGDVEDIVIYPNPEPENPKELTINNNYILDSQDSTTEDRRYDVIEPIYNQVAGFSYLIFNMRTQDVEDKLNLKLGQLISYKDIWENELEAYLMSIKFSWLGGNLTDSDNYEVTLSAEELSETNSNYSYAGTPAEKVSKLGVQVDKQNEEIKLYVKKGDVINQINLSEEGTKINANNISLEGLTTINGNFVIDLDGNLNANDASLENVKIRGGNLVLNDDGTNLNAAVKIKTQELKETKDIALNTNLSSKQLLLSFPEDLTTTLTAQGYSRENGKKENIIVTSNGSIVASCYYWRSGNYELGKNLEIYDTLSEETLYLKTIEDYGMGTIESINLSSFTLSEDYGIVSNIATSEYVNYIKYEEVSSLETSYTGNGMYATYSDENGNYRIESTSQLFALIHSNNNILSNFIINMYNENPEDDYILFSIAGKEIFRADKDGFHFKEVKDD